MNVQSILNNIVKDVKVNLTDEFDRNFERKAFFDRPWAPTNHPNERGSLLMRSGNLRNSITATEGEDFITWSSSMPYANIHNEGGEIVVTAKMKRFFWAMHLKAKGAATGGSDRDVRLGKEAMKWKAMALMPIGKRIQVKQRQFIGEHPIIKSIVEEAMNDSKDAVEMMFKRGLK